MISVVTGNKKCVSNISDANVLQYLLLVLYMLPTCESHACHMTPALVDMCVVMVTAQELVLEVFQALTSHTQIVKESIQKGQSAPVIGRVYDPLVYLDYSLIVVQSGVCLSSLV